MDLQDANRRLAAGQDLSRAEMQSVMRVIMRGEATPAQIGAFLTALTIKGESVEEIAGAAVIMRELAATVRVNADKIVDSVGTGGDRARLFNVSTAGALVAAAAGAVLAKHGNRAATGNSGSADVLEAAGVNIALDARQVGQCIEQCGIGFLFAPNHHAATRHVIGPRREIGIRTIFNLLGPLTNPAGATHQLVGVFDSRWVRALAEVFAELGSAHTLVVCSEDGLDEISIAAATRVAEYRDGEIREYRIQPEQFGIARTPLHGLVVADAAQSLALMREALAGTEGAAFDIVALNAGATLYAADLADSIAAGVARAIEVLRGGGGLEKLRQLAEVSAGLAASADHGAGD
ncbi:MAG: anthranilate phosphoribosyltransferase [Gammaproteobacteria bacterium]|nr:anthranilate phosphoribosyltransferase [Gammaproteobacteria bacterium]